MSQYQNKFYLFANWKMYLDYDESNVLANAIAGAAKKIPESVKMAVFPSALSLYPAAQVLSDVKIAVGAQDVYWVEKGGYTGEISAAMYRNAGCAYALVGHSERRHLFHESNHEVRQKIEAALLAGLTPVICVGETETERAGNKAQEVVEVQLRAALDNLPWDAKHELIIAYEPVWAIGTGAACDPGEAQTMHLQIKKIVAELMPDVVPVVLYGGSVRPANVAQYLEQSDINGVLVGGASTKLDEWLEIVQAAQL